MASRLLSRQIVTNVVGVVVIVGILAGVLYLAGENAANADVGDCLKPTGANRLEQVGCDDAAAEYKVIAKLENVRERAASSDACDPFKGQGTERVFWTGPPGKKGVVLCLAAVGG